MYAEIVVNTPLARHRIAPTQRTEGYAALDQTFTYAIPAHLRERVQAGQLVVVPFGARRLQGIIMSLSETTKIERLKEISEIADPQPVLSSAQLALAQWMSRYYVAPLIECVLQMFPPGLESEIQTTIAINPKATLPESAKEIQEQIVARLQKEGPLPLDELARGDRKKDLVREIEALVRRRILLREMALLPPRAKARKERTAQLLADHGQAQLAERHAPLQSAVLEFLQQQSESQAGVTADVIKEATGASNETLKALEKVHFIHFEERTVRLVAEPSKEMLAALHTPRQNAVLEYLLKQGGLSAIVSTRELMRVTGANADTLKALAQANFIRFDERVIWRDPLKGQTFTPTAPPELTVEQQAVWDVVRQGLNRKTRQREPGIGDGERGTGNAEAQSSSANLQASIPTYLLFGITGSGKTELYLRAVAEVLSQDQQAIVLVPEIALTPQTIRRFAERFPDQVMIMHSRLSLGERFDQWRRIRAGEVNVVIGSRSAIFAPLPKLGLIVLDEEHETAYKQDTTPRYHARDVALHYAELLNGAVILGSATPCLETMWRAERGEYQLLTLKQRIQTQTDELAQESSAPTPTETPTPSAVDKGRVVKERALAARVGLASGARSYAIHSKATELTPPSFGIRTFYASGQALPPVTIVDMRAELKAGNTSIFSRTLRDALTATLKAREQAILFLNRRGTATFVMCRDCGFVMKCKPCDNPVTYHADENELICHHCNRRYDLPKQCPACLSTRIRQFGTGTQKVEAAVQQLFPTARVMRWDRDTTGKKGAHDQLMKKFSAHEADVMVGTQMIAKGLDLPLVTLVGVISADTALHLPDFRASERTFQLLTQVAGRAGRGRLPGQVVFQTYSPTHPAIVSAAQHDYATFYQSELDFRRRLSYPPFGQLIRLLYVGSGRARAQQEAESLQRNLSQRIRQLGLSEVALIGPAPCFVHKLRSEYRWQILVKGPQAHELLAGFAWPLGWRVDVDPVNVL